MTVKTVNESPNKVEEVECVFGPGAARVDLVFELSDIKGKSQFVLVVKRHDRSTLGRVKHSFRPDNDELVDLVARAIKDLGCEDINLRGEESLVRRIHEKIHAEGSAKWSERDEEIMRLSAEKMKSEDEVEQARRLVGTTPGGRAGLPSEAAARKDIPVATGFIDYFPDAVAAVAELSKKGNDQHNPGKPLHWDRSKSQDEAERLFRHFLQRGTVDSDGVRHTAKVVWRAMAMLQKELEKSREG